MNRESTDDFIHGLIFNGLRVVHKIDIELFFYDTKYVRYEVGHWEGVDQFRFRKHWYDHAHGGRSSETLATFVVYAGVCQHFFSFGGGVRLG